MQRIVVLIILLFFSFILKSQSSWKISGYVFGEKETLAFATVYLTPISTDSLSKKILVFTSTDNDGYFELNVDSSRHNVLLVCNYLGYHKKVVEFHKGDSFPIKINLKSTSNQLSEVIVTDQIVPIQEQGDTVIYDAAQFRDSTETTVEDLLRKLPGVEIDGNGQIKIEGKPIKKMLIEGTDMFGRQYTMGSQNIPADYIESIEIINHHQENQVIKDIVSSEDIVLNLKLKDNVKNKLSGMLTEGVGYGDEWKAFFDVNIFSISKKQKYLWISNNGNTGEQYGLNQIKSTYSFNNKDILTDDVENIPKFTNELRPNYLSTAGQSVDNSINTFNTLRSFFELGSTLKLKLNTTFATQKEAQQIFDNITSLYQIDPYKNTTQQNLKLKNRLAKIDLTLNYINPSLKQSLDFYISYDNSTHHGFQNIDDLNRNKDLFSQVDFQNNKFLATAIYSLRLTDQSALIIKAKSNYFNIKEQFIGNNEDYNSVLTAPDTFEKIKQDLNFKNLLGEFSTSYLNRFSLFSFQAESKIKTTRLNLSPEWYGMHDSLTQDFPIISLSANNQKDFTWTNQLTLSREINSTSTANLSTTFFYRLFEQNDQRTEFNFSNSYTLKFWVTKDINSKTKLNAVYQYANNQLNNYDLISANYIRDNYNFSNNIPKTKLTGGHSFVLRFSQKNIRKLSSYYLSMILKIKEKRWIQDFTFFNSIINSQPYFVDDNNQIRISGKWDKFIPILKTNFEIKPRFSFSKNSLVSNGIISKIQVLNLGTSFVTAWRLHHSILFRLDGSFGKRYFKSNNSINNQLINIGITPFISWKEGTWNIKIFATYQNSFNQNQSAKILSSKFEIEKRINIKNRKTNVSLRFYNLFNQKNYKAITTGEYFIFENMIDAINPFFIFSIDQHF